MQAFIKHAGIAAPLLRTNIDTDAIIPSREMRRVSKRGLGDGLFAGWRYLDASSDMPRQLNPRFVLNQPQYAGTSILLGGDNFGCGSSREHAVWALSEFGIRAIISPGFGSIFRGNCVRNGILPIELPESQVSAIANWVEADPRRHQVSIDLESQSVQADSAFAFDIDAASKQMLVEGLDPIALTLRDADGIEAFEARRREARPWLWPSQAAGHP